MRDNRARDVRIDADSIDAMERQVAAIWCDVLGVAEVRASDNFSDLGGDSVAATMCLTAIFREFGCELSPVILIDTAMTVEQLTERIAAAVRA